MLRKKQNTSEQSIESYQVQHVFIFRKKRKIILKSLMMLKHDHIVKYVWPLKIFQDRTVWIHKPITIHAIDNAADN